MRKTFANALVRDKGNIGITPSVRDSMLVFYQRNMFIDSIPNNPVRSVIADSEDECIRLADEMDFDFVILTWEGNIFDIHRYHEKCINAVNNLDEKTNGNWLVMGQLIDQYENRVLYNDPKKDEWKNCFYLFPITAIVNLKKWRELGKPAWGGDDGIQNVVTVKPSETCIHDNYTPIEIYAGEGTLDTRVRKSWNFINASLSSGLTVYNIPVEVRNVQNYLYPEVNVERYNNFWTSLHTMPKLTDQYKKVLESVLHSKYPRRINDNTWQCFIKNTEDYTPRSDYHGSIDWTNIDTIILPSSGFKDFIVSMGKQGPRKQVDVIHFDIIRQCVDIRKEVIENWDGTRDNFGIVLGTIAARFKAQGKDCFHMHAMKELTEAYDAILPHFHSEEDLQQQWQVFKNFKHSYIEADMLEDPFGVLKLVTGKSVYICLSDIAGWRNNIIGYGYHTLRKNISNCIGNFKKRGLSGYVDYKDPGTDLQLWQEFNIAVDYLSKPLSSG